MASHDLATISNPSAALTDFTLVVDLARMSTDWWTAVDTTDGTKGRVYKGDGTTELACDWIDFDSTAETGELRVKWSGTLATTGTQQLWIEPPLAANAAVAATATYGSDNAYDSSWWGYWPNGGGTDRTSNSRDLTAYGSPTIGGAAGLLGAATDYNGTTQYCNIAAAPTALPLTMTAFYQPDNMSAGSTRLLGVDGSTQNATLYQNTDDVFARIGSPTDGTYNVLALNTWYSLGGRFSTTDVEVYHNGTGSGSPTAHALSLSAEDSVTLAALDYNGTFQSFFDGRLQHAQLHTAERSDAWHAIESSQVRDNATFWGTWTWVSVASTPNDSLDAQSLVSKHSDLAAVEPAQIHAASVSPFTPEPARADAVEPAQAQTLPATELVSGPPSLGAPGVSLSNALSAAELSSPSPAFAAVAVAQEHGVNTAAGLASESSLGPVEASQIHEIGAVSLVGQLVDLGAPLYGETQLTDDLTVSSLIALEGDLGAVQPAQGQAFAVLELNGRITPRVAVRFRQKHSIKAHELTATGEADAPIPGWHTLEAVSLASLPPECGAQEPTVGFVLSAASLAGGVEGGVAALSQDHGLAALGELPVSDNGVVPLSQVHSLPAARLDGEQTDLGETYVSGQAPLARALHITSFISQRVVSDGMSVFDDWYAPSRGDMIFLHERYDILDNEAGWPKFVHGPAGFMDTFYLCSTEAGADTVYFIWFSYPFNSGVSGTISKWSGQEYNRIIPFREFEAPAGMYQMGDGGPAGGFVLRSHEVGGLTIYQEVSKTALWPGPFVVSGNYYATNSIGGLSSDSWTGAANTQRLLSVVGSDAELAVDVDGYTESSAGAPPVLSQIHSARVGEQIGRSPELAVVRQTLRQTFDAEELLGGAPEMGYRSATTFHGKLHGVLGFKKPSMSAGFTVPEADVDLKRPRSTVVLE